MTLATPGGTCVTLTAPRRHIHDFGCGCSLTYLCDSDRSWRHLALFPLHLETPRGIGDSGCSRRHLGYSHCICTCLCESGCTRRHIVTLSAPGDTIFDFCCGCSLRYLCDSDCSWRHLGYSHCIFRRLCESGCTRRHMRDTDCSLETHT